MSSDIEFTNISAEFKGSVCTGKFKLTPSGISFKNGKTGKVDQISASDIELTMWVRLISVYGLRVFLKNGALQRYFGFKDTDQEKIAKFFSSTYEQELSEKELSIKGWNWGTAKFHGSVLTFEVNNLVDFDIPLNTVSQCTTGKNEVTLEFHQHDDATPVNLMELRFHIPSSELAGAKDPVEAFHDQVMQKASVISVSGDAIAIFREMQCLTPRGRYDIKMFQSFFQLHGKTFDYKVPMSTVIRLFILPHKDGRQHFLVISLDPPIKQGQTRYHFLVLLFNQDEDSSIELPFSEEEIQEKFEGKITKELNGPTYQVLGKIMKVLVNRKISTPGNFKGNSGTPAISCSYKAAAGYIYPLDRGFIYIHKPPIHIRFEEISSVNFARSGGSTRSFDFEIELKGGVVHTFSSIEKEEYGKLFEYIKQKDLKVKNVGKDKLERGAGDFGDSDQEAAPDAYLERVKREGEERDEDEESEDSTDEDFNPSGADESDDVAEEYDSNPTPTDTDTDSTSDESVTELKKSKVKAEKKTKKKIPDKQRKRKKPKDENKPKRPPSAYMLWFNEVREKIKADNPGISFTDIGKKGGELWKKITSSEKEEFEAKAAKAKEEYAIAMKNYKEKEVPISEDDSGKETKKSKSQPKSKSEVDTSSTSDDD